MAQLFEGLTDGRFVVLVLVVSLFSLVVQSMWRRYFPFKAPEGSSDLRQRVETLERDCNHLRGSYANMTDDYRRLERLVINIGMPADPAIRAVNFADLDMQLARLKVAVETLAEGEKIDPRPNQWERVSQDDDP